MSFAIDVGSDLYGTKVNVTLAFQQRPTVAELTAAVESNMDTKGRAARPAGYPDVPFKVETFQLFDDTLQRWVDLYNEQQLRSGAQLWCFQPESIWHSDAQGVIPQPEQSPVTWTTPLGSPRRGRAAADAGVPPTLSEKLRSVFYQIDGANKGYIVHQDLEAAFRRCDMAFNQGTAGDLFTIADQNRSQHITYDEWLNFAVRCPGIVDALFFRMRDMTPGAAAHSPPGPEAQAARQTELRQLYASSWQQGGRSQQEKEYALAREQEAQRRLEEAERALREHEAAMQQAQQAAQQHAQSHAAARQAASDRTAAMDAAQQALRDAEDRARMWAEKEAEARREHEQVMASRAAAERALQAAQQERLNAQQQADSEAAAQYAAEQHAAQQEQARRQATAMRQAAEMELGEARAAQEAARAAQAVAQQAAQARAEAQQAEQQAEQLRQQALREQQQLSSLAYNQPLAQAAPQGGAGMPQMSDAARRDYEAAKRRADDLRRQKEDAERAEREAWNKLYYSPASPHFGNSPQH